jgi:DDB1- and CUL4-associated factor 13
MASSIYLPLPPRGNGYREKGRLSNGLPSYSTAVQEKLGHRHSQELPWTTPITLPIPGVQTRRLLILVPNAARFHQFSVARFGRRKGPAFLCISIFALIFTVFALAKRFAMQDKKWPTTPFGTPPTLVFGREELQRIWQWEIQSGHYPSGQKSMQALDDPQQPLTDSIL